MAAVQLEYLLLEKETSLVKSVQWKCNYWCNTNGKNHRPNDPGYFQKFKWLSLDLPAKSSDTGTLVDTFLIEMERITMYKYLSSSFYLFAFYWGRLTWWFDAKFHWVVVSNNAACTNEPVPYASASNSETETPSLPTTLAPRTNNQTKLSSVPVFRCSIVGSR